MTLIECACGCGTLIEDRDIRGRPRKYVNGHQNRGKHLSEETRRKMSDVHKGKKPGNAGKPCPEEVKSKISKSLKGEKHPNYGKHHPELTKKRISEQLKKNYSEDHKRILRERMEGEKNPMWHKDFTDIHRQRLSEKCKSINNPNYGKKASAETRRKQSESHRGKHLSEEQKKKIAESNKTPENIKKHREARQHIIIPKHHTKPELIFMDICKKYNLHFKYVGDGSLWIGKDKTLNPDFIQADGEKIVVEIFGDYWHGPLLNPKVPEYATLEYRKKHYKKYGWKSYFIWGSDLKRPDAEQFVLQKMGVKSV